MRVAVPRACVSTWRRPVTLAAMCLAAPALCAQTPRVRPRASAAAPTSPQAPAGADPVQAVIDSGALKSGYNPVLLEFLTEEGKTKLPEKQRNVAIDQLVAGFQQQADIKPSTQAVAALATLAGLVTKGVVGEGNLRGRGAGLE
jgi:hypothetical protein